MIPTSVLPSPSPCSNWSHDWVGFQEDRPPQVEGTREHRLVENTESCVRRALSTGFARHHLVSCDPTVSVASESQELGGLPRLQIGRISSFPNETHCS